MKQPLNQGHMFPDEPVALARKRPRAFEKQFIIRESKTDIALALYKALEIGRKFEQDPAIPTDPRKITFEMFQYEGLGRN